jgi:hypothetical protein
MLFKRRIVISQRNTQPVPPSPTKNVVTSNDQTMFTALGEKKIHLRFINQLQSLLPLMWSCAADKNDS